MFDSTHHACLVQITCIFFNALGGFFFFFFFLPFVLICVKKHFGLFKHTDISYFRFIFVFLFCLFVFHFTQVDTMPYKRELNECLELSRPLSHFLIFKLNILLS